MDVQIRMLRAEFSMKCAIAKGLRDAELRELDHGVSDEWKVTF